MASWRRLGVVLLADAGIGSALSVLEGRIKVLSGGLGFPDLWLGFTATGLYQRFEAFGPEGRRLYFLAALVDLLFAAVYGTLFAFVLGLSARALFRAGSRWRLLCLLPYAATGADFLENASFLTVLFAWPARLPTLATVAGAFNVGKWAVYAVMLPLALLGLASMGARALTNRLRSSS